ncbi:E3 ubiquitin-protein ligase RNF4-like [Podarcis raffonei]|uniref:E3 ubiquitin-protein ligase RNF4-like n=1 Tax=Podarcis raffonei TaxID=65483 RepID=UPI00232967D5|nr:E3 ubiquitin-protein ligase RNF4-like [Podarcis raffonei]
MSSTSTECNATQHSNSKRGSRNTSARPPHTLDKMMVGTASEPCIPSSAASASLPHSLNDRSMDVEVVDLTCETSEPLVVDLTQDDSLVLVGESGQQPDREFRPQPLSDSLVFSGGGGDDSRHTQSGALATRKLPREVGRREFARSSGTLSCGICIDSFAEIVQSGWLIVSTTCGHIFCSQCLSNFLRYANFCPICRRHLTPKEFHPIYM